MEVKTTVLQELTFTCSLIKSMLSRDVCHFFSLSKEVVISYRLSGTGVCSESIAMATGVKILCRFSAIRL